MASRQRRRSARTIAAAAMTAQSTPSLPSQVTALTAVTSADWPAIRLFSWPAAPWSADSSGGHCKRTRMSTIVKTAAEPMTAVSGVICRRVRSGMRSDMNGTVPTPRALTPAGVGLASEPALGGGPATGCVGEAMPGFVLPGPRVDVRRAADAVLHAPAGFLDHPSIEPCAGHDGEVLAVHRTGVQQPALPAQPYPHRLGQVGGDPQVPREQIRRAGRQDRQHSLRPGHGVDAALDRPVAAPDEYHLSAVRQRAAGALGCLAALRHLQPERIGNALPRQHLTKLPQAAAEILASVCHNSDPPHAGASVFPVAAGRAGVIAGRPGG